jgi:4-hydroxy-tetrahydrodipicolinate reductase
MRIGIAGYGRMGRLIRKQALAKGYKVAAIIDPSSDAKEITARAINSALLPIDVIIDFTNPAAVLKNVKSYAEFKVPAVIGTTGWYDQIDDVAAIVNKSGLGLIWSGNFSLGVNLFFKLVEAAANVMQGFAQYDVMIHEVHHRQKKDSPSGTAEMIGSILLDSLKSKKTIIKGNIDRALQEDELHISSTRGGNVPGTHQIIFDSAVDTIILEHIARERTGFAEGALLAAEWIRDKKGFYRFEDLMQSVIGGD